MLGRSRILFATIAVTAVAACNRGTPTSDTALQRDLDMARGQGLELAPQGGTQLVSANELLPAGSRTKVNAAPTRHARAAAPVHQASAPPAPTTVAPAAAAPAPAPKRDSAVAMAPATVRPSAQGAVSPPPPGGYKSMGDIIRHAPFPINP
jgi:hypothetical protein